MHVHTRFIRAWGRIHKFFLSSIQLWAKVLQQHRPWEEEWLKWTSSPEGTELRGSVIPPLGQHDRQWMKRHHRVRTGRDWPLC